MFVNKKNEISLNNSENDSLPYFSVVISRVLVTVLNYFTISYFNKKTTTADIVVFF